MSANWGRKKSLHTHQPSCCAPGRYRANAIYVKCEADTLDTGAKYTHNRNTLKHLLVVELILQSDFEGITLPGHYVSILSLEAQELMMSTFIPEIIGAGRVPPPVTKERLKPSGAANAFLITKSVTGPMEAKAPPMNGRMWAGRTICRTRRSCLWSYKKWHAA